MPAQQGNRNAMKAGLHGFLAIGSLPKGAGYVRRCAGKLRREIERAILDQRGQLTLAESALAQSAARHEIRALLASRWLWKTTESMTAAERVAYLREIGNATAARDAILTRLGLAPSDVTGKGPGGGFAPVLFQDAPEGDNGEGMEPLPKDNASAGHGENPGGHAE